MSSKDTLKVILVLVAFVASLDIVWDIFVNVSQTIKNHPLSVGVILVVIVVLVFLRGGNDDK